MSAGSNIREKSEANSPDLHAKSGKHALGWAEQPLKSFLLKMAIGCQRVNAIAFAHELKANRVAERICLVLAHLQKSTRRATEALIDPDHLDLWAVE
jgi:hypothetical protein